MHSPKKQSTTVYQVFQSPTNINVCCSELDKNEKLHKYITNANTPGKHTTTTNNCYLTFNQLSNRVRHLQSSLNKERLKSLNNDRKLVRLNKSLLLHQRFMIFIKENSIPKLHELVKVVMNRKSRLGLAWSTKKKG